MEDTAIEVERRYLAAAEKALAEQRALQQAVAE